MNKWTTEDIEFLKTNYPIHGAEFCSVKLNKSIGSVMHQRRKFKIYLANRAMNRKKPSYEGMKINPNIFMKPTIKEACYILGLLKADSYISNNCIVLENVKDDVIIFQPIFNKCGKWSYYERSRAGRRTQSTLLASNTVLANFLRSNGYYARSIENYDRILSVIPSEFRHLFFRGLIDGDGCFYINHKNRTYQFSIAGSYEQDWTSVENLFKSLQIKYRVVRRYQKRPNGEYNKSSVIRIVNRPDIIKLGKYIYNDFPIDEIGLYRKYNKYQDMLNVQIKMDLQSRPYDGRK